MSVDRESLRGIKIKVRFAPEKLAPVDDVPQGTTKELITWVGSSELRAKRVLARELTEFSPRVQLVRALHEMLFADAP
jgi:hypothetical protein